ncbi:hypothetical protein OGAPHI_002086 [Ogataea philodendri]|uniref:Molybdopterin adenylyltransferase n=1 Tax=Ogataea philodendri TaxID=1378263 RepID=A0A9P8PAJ9_9ASCO|nr:uncharacterized protein OGAPHI_002086 [Ogataea philodendri]KAH3668332.1 hypothetical protein OGAPHI_002086 [Ogataea philodendri]
MRSTVINSMFSCTEAISSISSRIPWITTDLRSWFGCLVSWLDGFLLVWVVESSWNIDVLYGALLAMSVAVVSLTSSLMIARTRLTMFPAANSRGWASMSLVPTPLISSINSAVLDHRPLEITRIKSRHVAVATFMSVAILVVSDSVAKGKSEDKVVGALSAKLEDLNLAYSDVVSDDKAQIQSKVLDFVNKGVQLVLTCGGTGFTQHDITPEAIEPLLEKKAPGLVHAMLSFSLKVTPFAMLARPVAGVRGQTLIVTLPGSPKGATENFEAIQPVLKHALPQLGVESARALHSHGHSHGHHHGHGHGHLAKHTLTQSVVTRDRVSPYPAISVPEAYEKIVQHTPQPEILELSVLDPQVVGSVVAEDIYSSLDVPNFRASIVDGYAVVAEDGPGTYPVVTVSHANRNEKKVLVSGEIARITTGAPLPDGANAVVMVEETKLVQTTDDGKEEKLVEILAQDVKSGENIRAVGSDTKKGSLVLAKGSRISVGGGEIGALASVGVKLIKVYRKPTIGVLSTGNELQDLKTEKSLHYGEIYDSNRPTLISMVENSGYKVVDLGIAADTKSSLTSIIRDAFDKKHIDCLITTGGVSMGEMDLLKPTIEHDLDGTIHFGRVRMKPGKPTTFATIGNSKVVFALPGNPASSSVCYHLFVLPSLLKWQGLKPVLGQKLPTEPIVKVKLTSELRLDPQRPEYQRVSIRQENMHLVASSTGFQRSSNIGSFKNANGLYTNNQETLVQLNNLKISELKSICRSIGLVLSGRKAEIAGRIEQYFASGRYQGDQVRLLAVRALIMKASVGQELPPYQSLYALFRTNAHTIQIPNQYTAPEVVPKPIPAVVFKKSEFYVLKHQVHASGSNPLIAPQKQKDRGSCRFIFHLTPEEKELLQSSANMKLSLLSGTRTAGENEQYLEFPQPNEITMNGVRLKQTGRGIKGRPGSAKPIDLMANLRLNETNRLEVVYAFTNTDFWLYLYILEEIPASRLVDQILGKQHISVQTTIEAIKERHLEDDDDLVQTDKEVLSLMCPCSFIKMRYPCRSIKCGHIQCFDALSFLQLQQQAPTWQCPVCSNRLNLDDLAIDDYFQAIVEKTGEDDEAVEIDEVGNWAVKQDAEQEAEQGPARDLREKSQTRQESEAPVAVISLESDESDVGEPGDLGRTDGVPEKHEHLAFKTALGREAAQTTQEPPTSMPQNGIDIISLDSEDEIDASVDQPVPNNTAKHELLNTATEVGAEGPSLKTRRLEPDTHHESSVSGVLQPVSPKESSTLHQLESQNGTTNGGSLLGFNLPLVTIAEENLQGGFLIGDSALEKSPKHDVK